MTLVFFSGLVLFFLVLGPASAQGPTLCVPDQPYEGTVGDGKYYRFFTDKRTDLHSVSLKPGTNSSVQLIIQDMQGHIFSTLQAPFLYDDKVVSTVAKKVICKTKGTTYYDFFPAGQPGANYTLLINSLAGQLQLGEPVNSSYPEGPADLTWFFYDYTGDDQRRPLEITVRSDQDIKSRLVVIQTDCPTLFRDISSTEMASRPNGYLSWSTQARMTLSNARKPVLAPGRWFIGVQTQNFTVSKKFQIDVAFGLSPNDYTIPMLVPPLAMLGVILGILISSLLIMSLLTKRVVTKKLKPVSNSWGYFLLTSTVGIVFLVPGFQVITEELIKMEESGDRDLCYYNEMCMKPSGGRARLMAQNNVYSNVGYFVVGLGFIVYAWVVRLYSKRSKINVGVPRDGSIPYAMGVAIMLEGLASGLYHFCPSRIMFQFDSANMFVIAALGLAEIFRRAFYAPSKPSLFFFLAVLLLMNYLGALAEVGAGGQLQEFVTRANLVWIFLVLLVVFFVGYLFPFMLRKPTQKYFQFWKELTWSGLPKPGFVFWLILTLTNCGLLIIMVLVRETEFANTFLGMLIMSQIISLLAYEIGNLKHFSKTPKLFLAVKLTLILAFVASSIGAVWYFHSSTSNKVLSPEASRARNSPCVVADFYDSHDMWHFLSALSLLFMCLIFFHLDLNAHWKGYAIGERTANGLFIQSEGEAEEEDDDSGSGGPLEETEDGILQILVDRKGSMLD